MADEIASKTLDATIIAQARVTAEANPGIRIRCPWCSEGVLGEEYLMHEKTHGPAAERMDAIILAGGKGSRLAPWPAPKCLLPINGVPIIIRLLDHLLVRSAAHVGRVIVCTGYRGGDVGAAIMASHFASAYCEGGVICISDAGEDAPMGARLLAARELMKSERQLICYGDELADVDIGELLRWHIEYKRPMTFTCAKQRVTGGALVDINFDGIVIDEEHTVDVNIGFVVVERSCWESLAPTNGLSTWITNSHYKGGARPYRHEGKRATINSLADLQYAEEVWK